MPTLNFLKMEGLGNDFLVTHEVTPESAGSIARQAVKLCDRRKGVGGDGVLLILPPASDGADFTMRIFNSDGSEAEMCGNGIRCCAKYVRESGLSAKQSLSFETGAGRISTVFTENDHVRVNMGAPVLDAPRIPTTQPSGKILRRALTVDGRQFEITAVSMGNPHAVIYVDQITDDLVLGWGKKIETLPFFPKKTNVEFIKIISWTDIGMRVWERGCGETFACGTGACAAAVSGIVNNLHGKKVTVHLLGGRLLIEWDGLEKSPVFMTGPANIAFKGCVGIDA